MKHPKIIISCNPEQTQDFSQYAAVINVSDSACQTFRVNVPSFWFPIHETGRWGYSAFYGAAKVVDQFRDSDKPILIHCHAGANRSPSVTYAVLASDGLSDQEIDKMFPLYGGISDLYRHNIQNKCIEQDTIRMLMGRHDHPTYSICGLLQACGSKNLFHPEFKKKFVSAGTFQTKTL